jgi:hypothetical protein
VRHIGQASNRKIMSSISESVFIFSLLLIEKKRNSKQQGSNMTEQYRGALLLNNYEN